MTNGGRCVQAGSGRKIHQDINGQTQRRAEWPKLTEFTLPGKSSKENGREPYLKPTQVDEENIQRRSRERLLRNSAN